MLDNTNNNIENTRVQADGSDPVDAPVSMDSQAAANALLKGTEELSGGLFTLIEEVACRGNAPVKGLSTVPTIVFGLYRNIKDESRFSEATIDLGKNVAIALLPWQIQAALKFSEVSAAASEHSEEYLRSFVVCYENGIDDHELERLHEQGMVWAMGLPAKGINWLFEKIKQNPLCLVPTAQLLVSGVELVNPVFHKQPLSLEPAGAQGAGQGGADDGSDEAITFSSEPPRHRYAYAPCDAAQAEILARQRMQALMEPRFDLKKLTQPVPLGGKVQFKPSFDLFSDKISLGLLWQFGAPTPITIVGIVGGVLLHKLAMRMEWYRDFEKNLFDNIEKATGNEQVKYRCWTEKNLPKYYDQYFPQFDKALPAWMNKILNMDPSYVQEERQMASALHEANCKFFGTDSDRSERRDKFFGHWADNQKHPDEKHRHKMEKLLLKEYNDVVGYDGGSDRRRECGDLWHIFDRYKRHDDGMQIRKAILEKNQIFDVVKNGFPASLQRIQADGPAGESFLSALQDVLLYSNRQIMQGGEGVEAAMGLWITCLDGLSRRDFLRNDQVHAQVDRLLYHLNTSFSLTKCHVDALSPLVEKLVTQATLHTDDPRAVSILSACGGMLCRFGHEDQGFVQSVFKQCFELDLANRASWASLLVALPGASEDDVRLYFAYLNDQYRDAMPDKIRGNDDETLRLLSVGQDLLKYPGLLAENAEILRCCAQVDQDNYVWRQIQNGMNIETSIHVDRKLLVENRKRFSGDGSDEFAERGLPQSRRPTREIRGMRLFNDFVACGKVVGVSKASMRVSQDDLSMQMIQHMHALEAMLRLGRQASHAAIESGIEYLRGALIDSESLQALDRLRGPAHDSMRFLFDEELHHTGTQLAESVQFLLDRFRMIYPEALPIDRYLQGDSCVEAWSRMHEIFNYNDGPMGVVISLFTGGAMIHRNMLQQQYERCHDPDRKFILFGQILADDAMALLGNTYQSSAFFFSSGISDDLNSLEKVHTISTGVLYLGYYVSNFFSKYMYWKQEAWRRETGYYDESRCVALWTGLVRGMGSNPLLATRVFMNANIIGISRMVWLVDRVALKAIGREVFSSACAHGGGAAMGYLVNAGVRMRMQEETVKAALRLAADCVSLGLVALDVLTITLLAYDAYQYSTFIHGDTQLSNIMIDVQKAEAFEQEARKHQLANDQVNASEAIQKAQKLFASNAQRIANLGDQFDRSERLSTDQSLCRLRNKLGSVSSEHFQSTHQSNELHVIQAAHAKLSKSAEEVFNEALNTLKQDAMFNKKREGLVSWLSHDAHGIYHEHNSNHAIGWASLAAKAFLQRHCTLGGQCFADVAILERESGELNWNDNELKHLHIVVDQMKGHLLSSETNDFINGTPAGFWDHPEARYNHLKAHIDETSFNDQTIASEIKGFHLARADLHRRRFEWTQDSKLKDSRTGFAWHLFESVLDYLKGGDAGLREKYQHHKEFDKKYGSKLASAGPQNEMLFHLLSVNTGFLFGTMGLNMAFRLMALSERRREQMEVFGIQVKANAFISIVKECWLRIILDQINELRHAEGALHSWKETRGDLGFALRLGMPVLSVCLPTMRSVGNDRIKASWAARLVTLQLACTVTSLLCYVLDTLMANQDLRKTDSEIDAIQHVEAGFCKILFGATLILSQCSSVIHYQHLLGYFERIATGRQPDALGGMPSYSTRMTTVLNRSLIFNVLTALSPFYFYFTTSDLSYHLTTFRLVHEDARWIGDGMYSVADTVAQGLGDFTSSNMPLVTVAVNECLSMMSAMGPAAAYTLIAIFLTWLVHSVLRFDPPAYEERAAALKPDNMAGWRSLVDAVIGFNLFAHYHGMTPPTSQALVATLGIHGRSGASYAQQHPMLQRHSGVASKPEFDSARPNAMPNYQSAP